MAIQTRREAHGRITDIWNRPVEWAHGLSLRLLGWFNQERWVNTLVLTALLLSNLLILFFFIRGQTDYAIAFTVFALLLPLMWFIPELAVAVAIVSGGSLLINALYYASPIPGTGEYSVNTAFTALLSARALYEYVKTPPTERPRVFTWFTIAVALFWLFYIGHVAYIYLFLRDLPPPNKVETLIGLYRPGLFRYFDYHILWIGALPMIVLLRDIRRAKRALMMVGIVVCLGVATLVAEYFAPLPEAWKILFQIRAAGETGEGYRVREPAVVYLMVAALFAAVYSLGYLRGWRAGAAVGYILVALYAVLITKNRALWAPLMLLAPLALLWKPPFIIVRQAQTVGIVTLLFLSGLFYPPFYEAVQRNWTQAVERWQRNYAFGGDPRNDPSYQWRIREREAWEFTMREVTTSQLLVGRGLEATYGFYIPLSAHGYQSPLVKNLVWEKLHMHFSWLDRILRIGLIGTVLMALAIGLALLRIAQAFLQVKAWQVRALLMGVGVATVAMVVYDSIHTNMLARPSVLPIVLLWSLAELAFHWKRTGQLLEG